MKTKVTVSPQAHEDLRRLGPAAKDAVGDFVRRLRADRNNRSLRMSPLRATGDNGRLILAVLGGQRMALLLETEANRLTVLALRQGTLARDELARITIDISPVSGGIELVDQSEASVNVLALPERANSSGAPQTTAPQAPLHDLPVPLFARHDDDTLTRLGVAAHLLPALRQVIEDRQLDALLGGNLPMLTKDVLTALRSGMDPDDVQRHITSAWRTDEHVDPGDWERAARRPVSQVDTEDPAVLDALGEGFEAWRLFLHPEQRRLASVDFKGSAKITGGPGTGKTVVALHRVKHLVDRLPPGDTRPVLLTTYNTNLAADLKERLRLLGGAELIRRVDVKSIDQLAREVLVEAWNEPPGRPLDDQAALDLWHTVCLEAGSYDLDAAFLDSEFQHVILAQRCDTPQLYYRAERRGRGQLQRPQRIRVWELMQAYREHLSQQPRTTTYAIVADQAARIEEARVNGSTVGPRIRPESEQHNVGRTRQDASIDVAPRFRYRHIVVDEAQDLSASHWRMLRAMVPQAANDIFLVGDAHQRIYAHHVVLGRLGIETRGRASRRLTLNYRTTQQILVGARELVCGHEFDDLDAGVDTLDGYRSVLTGLAPQYWRAPDWRTEMSAVAALIKERHERYGTPYSAMAVGVPDGMAVEQLSFALQSAPYRLPTVELGKIGPGQVDGVRIGTMHRFKGLEFQRVFLAGISDGQVPHQSIETFRRTNPDRYRQERQRARSTLFVAATRARDELVVSWNGMASDFLPEGCASQAHNAAELLSGDGPPSGSAVA
ncbi:UvrD-helicase domain-containing protein [Embleya scabrispora]|nr:UvrD-helicase domain-containing protein [Embleya scabrispora]